MKADDLRPQARCGEALIIKIFTIMTKENKELLFKDLSARLPYHVKCKVWLEDGTTEDKCII